jgi:hypothetical protein
MFRMILFFNIVFILFLTGCASTSLKQGAYEGLYARQCVKDTGLPACNNNHMSYDAYKSERDKLIN